MTAGATCTRRDIQGMKKYYRILAKMGDGFAWYLGKVLDVAHNKTCPCMTRWEQHEDSGATGAESGNGPASG